MNESTYLAPADLRRVPSRPTADVRRAVDAYAEARRMIGADADLSDEAWLTDVNAIHPIDREIRAQEQRFRLWMRDEGGVEVVGSGSTRVVLRLTHDAVLKVPMHGGEAANVAEARLWARAKPRLERYLMPILAADPKGRWLVMRYGDEPLESPSHEALRTLRQLGVEDVENEDNWREYEGRPVLVDYVTDRATAGDLPRRRNAGAPSERAPSADRLWRAMAALPIAEPYDPNASSEERNRRKGRLATSPLTPFPSGTDYSRHRWCNRCQCAHDASSFPCG